MVMFELGMAPRVYWDMTPAEFNLAVKALNRKLQREQTQAAVLQANIMNHMRACLGARKIPRVKVSRLLGFKTFDRNMSKKQITEYFRSKGKL